MLPRSSVRPLLLILVAAAFFAYAAAAAVAPDPEPKAPPLTTTGQPVVTDGTAGPGAVGGDPIARGKFLTEVLGCVDCHTPKGPDGKLDMKFYLAGHRAEDSHATWSDSLWDEGMGMIVSPSGTAFARDHARPQRTASNTDIA
jgi:hypothetical protein